MARSDRPISRAKSVARQPWWVMPSVAGGCVAAIVIVYLHVHFGSMEPARAAGTAVANIAIFLATYIVFRRIAPKHHEDSLVTLVASAVVALPVFILAFIGLGYEIPVMADFAVMYILGVWIGSAEAAERSDG